MKKSFVIILAIVLIVLVGGFLGWKFLAKKSGEGGVCKTDKNCEAGLKCVMNVCSSGERGSPCQTKADCKTQFCVSGRCTEGKEGDFCLTFEDCDGILCVNSVCSRFSEKPNEKVFKEYFSELSLGIVKEWPKEGPPAFEKTNVFKLGEQLCVAGTVLKDVSPAGEIYNPYEEVIVVPKMTGGTTIKQGGFVGCSSLPPQLSAGKKYEYKVYIGDTLVAVLPFEVVK